jgi:hypothetical protein
MYLGPYFFCQNPKNPFTTEIKKFKCCGNYKRDEHNFCYKCGKNEIEIAYEKDYYNDPLNSYTRGSEFFNINMGNRQLDWPKNTSHAYFPLEENEGIETKTIDSNDDDVVEIQINQELIEKTTAEFIKRFGEYIEKLKQEFEIVKIKWGILN